MNKIGIWIVRPKQHKLGGTGLVLILAAWVLTILYSQSPQYILSVVQSDMDRLGVKRPQHISQTITMAPMRPSVYAFNGTMNAHANRVALYIVVNSKTWHNLNTTQKKLLVLHEYLHSGMYEDIYHCYDRRSIMSSPNLRKIKADEYDKWLVNTLKYHDLIE